MHTPLRTGRRALEAGRRHRRRGDESSPRLRALRLRREIVSRAVGPAIVGERTAENSLELGLAVAVVHRLGQFDFGDAGDVLKETRLQGEVRRGRAVGLGQSIRADIDGGDAVGLPECPITDLGYL